MQLKLPELGEGVHEGELIKWKVKVGDTIKDDQLICEIMTDKATVELPSPVHGKVTELNAKEGEMVKVGQVLLSFEGAAGKTVSAPVLAAAPSTPASRPATTAAPVQQTLAATGGHVAAAPSTRRLAREMGVDINTISGSGPHGRIMREDLGNGTGAVTAGAPQMARGPRPAGAQTEERVPLRGLRKKIAEKMRLSKDKAAHFTYVEECDATALVELRHQAKEIGAKQGIKVTYLPFIMKAMVAALKQYPILNSSLDEEKGEIVYKHYYNIGLSIQTDDGLTAPVIKDVGGKSVLELAREIQNTVERARAKKLTTEDFQGGTITLTNAGSIGGLFATPILNYPEVAILGFNKIDRKPVVKKINGREEIVIRDWTLFSISLDHRIVDGAIGAEFMKLFIKYIETPGLLVLESI